jgi:hypothetical protein
MDTANPPRVFGAGHSAGVTTTGTLVPAKARPAVLRYYLIANLAQPTRASPTSCRAARRRERTTSARAVHDPVDFEDPRLTDTPVSAIESLDAVGIVVERSMWWPRRGRWQEGHLSAGSTVTAQLGRGRGASAPTSRPSSSSPTPRTPRGRR